MYKYERFKTKAEARKRQEQLAIGKCIMSKVYKGHRGYVVQYWVQS